MTGSRDRIRRTLHASVLFHLLLALIVSHVTWVPTSAHEGGAVRPTSRREGAPFQKGVTFTAWWEGHYRRPRSKVSLTALADTGANWISLAPTAHQETYASTEIDYTHSSTPSDQDLIHVIGLAHSLGLKVMLKPHVDLWNEAESGRWRGDIGTGFQTEAEWSAWFASYRDFIGHYARLAAEHGVDQFCIGTELLGTSHREADWRSIVSHVRQAYDGPLTYASLHGSEAKSITWWDAVDAIGIDAYYPLTDCLDPSLAQLKTGWEQPIEEMSGLSSKYGKDIILTEIGYESLDGCAMQPWHSPRRTVFDMEEQALAYRAAFESLRDQSWLAGVFWWEWFSDPFQSGPCDRTMSPHQKPAEDILREWYGGEPREHLEALADYDRASNVYRDRIVPGWQNWSWGSSVTTDASQPIHGGSHSIAVTLEPWGALSLWHPPFRTDDYEWLEFYIRRSSTSRPTLSVYFTTEEGKGLVRVPVCDCRHIRSATIEDDAWKRVRLPMRYLNPEGRPVTRLIIQDRSGMGSEMFWVDDVRFVPAVSPETRVFLPLSLRRW